MASKNILTAHTVASAFLLKTCKKRQATKSSEPNLKSKIKVHPIAWQEIQTSVKFANQNVQPKPIDHIAMACCVGVRPGLELLISDYVKVWFCHLVLLTLAQNNSNAILVSLLAYIKVCLQAFTPSLVH